MGSRARIDPDLRPAMRAALARLGVRRLLLGVHDAAFPVRRDEDVGYGTPHAEGAAGLLSLAHAMGFDGLQLGPQGATSPGNASPYDGAFFSRDPLAVGLADLTRDEWGGLLPGERLAGAVREAAARDDRVDHARAVPIVEALLSGVAARFRARAAAGEAGAIGRIADGLARFRAAEGSWLERDALHECMRRERGAPLGDAPSWTEVARDPGRYRAGRERFVEDYALVQYVLATQHEAFHARARSMGLSLFGDLQVGMSERDAWAARDLLLQGWWMGAPPSRTNPEGQPWNYPVLDPRLLRDPGGGEGPALAFFRARLRRFFSDYDGIRIDHPHGLVCPWVYPAGADPGRAVKHLGTRLFESPDVPALAAMAIARPEQLDHGLPRHADGWVRWLEPDQVGRYGVLVDVVLDEAARRGVGPEDVAVEILSTVPLPLRLVAGSRGLGRFRVTQKADLGRPDDGYRSENARPEDWIQMGTHDTPPVWSVAARWIASGEAPARATYLAGRLRVPDADRDGWVARVAAHTPDLVAAQCADLFVGPAANVLVYFSDLFGATRPYNEPGTISPDNWSQRVPRDPAEALVRGIAGGRALDLPAAVAAALRARGLDGDGLAARLEAASGAHHA